MLKLRHSLAATFFAASITGAASTSAQEITVFEHDNFTGRRFAANASVADLGTTGFNDRASSIVVRSGTWQVCSDHYYRGRCVTLTNGDYPSLASLGLNDRVSSIRELGWQRDGAAQRDGGRAAGPAVGRIALYDDTNLGGRGITVDQVVTDFERIGFNDRANSAVISDGAWELCEHAEFRGTCQIYPPGRYANLGALTGVVSSARPVAVADTVGVGGGAVGAGGGAVGAGGGWGDATVSSCTKDPTTRAGCIRWMQTSCAILAVPDSTIARRRCASSAGTGSSAAMRTSRATAARSGRAIIPISPGLANRISSGRRIANEYPYNQPPTWRDSTAR